MARKYKSKRKYYYRKKKGYRRKSYTKKKTRTRGGSKKIQKGGFFNPFKVVSNIVDTYIVGNPAKDNLHNTAPDIKENNQTKPPTEEFKGGSKYLNHIHTNISKLKSI